MNSAQLSMSIARQARPRSTAASTNHGAAAPSVGVVIVAMKNAANPRSGTASAAAREAEANDTRARVASTMRTRFDGGVAIRAIE